MTLDLILYRPEFFMIFGFFVLLWAGTGNLVTPVAEMLTITSVNGYKKNGIENSIAPAWNNKSREFTERMRVTPRAGPAQVSAPLT
jgi:hypothetical protein